MAVKTAPPIAATLDAIARAAPTLRAAGVLEIAIDGVSAKFAPAAPAPAKDEKPPREVQLGSLDDFRREDEP